MDTRKFKVVLVRMESGRRACRIRQNTLKVATLSGSAMAVSASQGQHYMYIHKTEVAKSTL